MELSERKEKILAAVVEQYIKTGEPVGSKALLDSLDMSVSSATVRNEMADLGYLGLLDQPHTSAGRVPTGEGYRYYVDNLVPESELSEESRRLIDAGIGNANGDPESLLRHAGEALAYLTQCAAVMTTPSGENTKIKRVELVPISPHTAMIVLLASNGILRSKLFRLDSAIDTTICETFYNVAGRVYGWEATTQAVDDWIFDDIAKTFVLDPETRAFFDENNPWALEEIARRLLEAEARHLWKADPDVLAELREAYMDIEGTLEDRTEAFGGEFQGGSIDIVTSDDVAEWKRALEVVRGNNQ